MELICTVWCVSVCVRVWNGVEWCGKGWEMVERRVESDGGNVDAVSILYYIILYYTYHKGSLVTSH